jgi:hypothetical protein
VQDELDLLPLVYPHFAQLDAALLEVFVLNHSQAISVIKAVTFYNPSRNTPRIGKAPQGALF